MNSMVLLADLPSAYTIHYLTRSLSLKDTVVATLKAQKVDGQFLRKEYLLGFLITTLLSHPFNIPLGTCSKIESWVQASIRKGEQYEVNQIIVNALVQNN